MAAHYRVVVEPPQSPKACPQSSDCENQSKTDEPTSSTQPGRVDDNAPTIRNGGPQRKVPGTGRPPIGCRDRRYRIRCEKPIEVELVLFAPPTDFVTSDLRQFALMLHQMQQNFAVAVLHPRIPGLIPSPGTQPRSPIGGQHCREAFLQVLDEILGNLQRREMSPGLGRPPSDDLSVPLLCPGARILLDVAGILGDC
jgi:hypothetical protein